MRFADGNGNVDANDNADGNGNADANDNAEMGEYFYSERRSSECSPNQLNFDSGFRGGVRTWRPCCCVYEITHHPPKLNLFLLVLGGKEIWQKSARTAAKSFLFWTDLLAALSAMTVFQVQQRASLKQSLRTLKSQ